MPVSLDCPKTESWQALFRGAIPDEQRERYEKHLETCPDCQAQLDRAEPVWDELLQLAREIGDPTRSPADALLLQAHESLLKSLSSDWPAPVEPADLYFLRPATGSSLLGLLGTYEVQEVIGQGGMGLVLKAFDPPLNRLVAIKVVNPILAGSARARRRFIREAQAAAAVSHEHIVPVHGVHEVDGLPYLVMQFVEGETLQARLDRMGPLPIDEVVRIGLQTAQGLAAAHAQGLIHRDIKPANILLSVVNSPLSVAKTDNNDVQRTTDNGQRTSVKITDFGLARLVDDVGLTQNGVVAGTPEYMAPEQARGELVDHRADLFSLGSVLYALCTGVPPFRAATPLAVLRQVSDVAPRPVRSLKPEVPAWLEALITRLLAKDPAGRYQSAAEVAALLEGYLDHLREPATVAAPALAPAPPADPRRSSGVGWSGSRPGRPRRYGPAALVLVALLVVGLLIWGLRAQPVMHEAAKPQRQHRVFDFRTPVKDLTEISFFGPDAENVTQTDAKGLRITLPADRPDCNNVGLEFISTIRGDFEIDAGYEILAIGAPIPIPAAGVQLRLLFDDAYPQATITRLRCPYPPRPAPLYGVVGHDGEIFAAFWILSLPNGNETGFDKGIRVRAKATIGRLRLIRTGTQLSYLARDADAPYQLLRSQEIGNADVQTVRLFGFSGWGPVAVDVRLTDLVIDADRFADAAPQVIVAGWFSDSRAWLSAALVAGLLLSLLLAAGLWVYGRRRSPMTEPAQATAVRRPGAFACPGCGKQLRARPELAGKRVKCPKCGNVALAPGGTAC